MFYFILLQVGTPNPSQMHPQTGLRFMAGYGDVIQEHKHKHKTLKNKTKHKPEQTNEHFLINQISGCQLYFGSECGYVNHRI